VGEMGLRLTRSHEAPALINRSNACHRGRNRGNRQSQALASPDFPCKRPWADLSIVEGIRDI